MRTPTIIRRTVLALAAAALCAGAAAHAQGGPKSSTSGVSRVIAKGSDGAINYYAVHCEDGARGDVRVEHDTARTCAVGPGGTSRCATTLTIQRAAELVCTGGSR